MFRSSDADTTESVDIEVHEIMVDACSWMVAHDLEVDIFVDEGEQAAQVGLKCFESLVNVGLRHVFTVGFRVLKEEAVSLCLSDVVWGDSKVVGLGICGRCLAVSSCRDGRLSLVTVTPEVCYPSCGWQDLSGQAESEKAQKEHFENVGEIIECKNCYEVVSKSSFFFI